MLFIAFSMSLATGTFAADKFVRGHNPVPGRYMVRLVDHLPDNVSVDSVARTLVPTNHGRIRMTWSKALNGFVVETSEQDAIALSKHPLVEFVEEDEIVQVATVQSIPSGPLVQEAPATMWYLDRIDQAAPTAPRTNGSYWYCTTGQGVRIYIVDTGVLDIHPDLLWGNGSSRVTEVPELVAYLKSRGEYLLKSQCWTTFELGPDASHGTAVAGFAAGTTFGVAKLATIADWRTFNCSGQQVASYIVDSLNYIPQDPHWLGEPRVVNCSFAAPQFAMISAAADGLVTNYGMTVVVAAGNENSDTLLFSPAGGGHVITVGGLAQATDTRWQYSNYRVDLYAPAQWVEGISTSIRALFPQLDHDKYRSELAQCYSYPQDGCTSGTSFASPIVAGLAARYLQLHHSATAADVLNYLESQASSHVNLLVSDPVGSAPIANTYDCSQ